MTANPLAPDFRDVQAIANAISYEGYTLYPYRPSSIKNRVPWNFGGVYPRIYAEAQAGADAWTVGCECLVRGRNARLAVETHFLEAIADEATARARAHDVRTDLGTAGQLTSSSMVHAFRRGRLEGALEVTAFALEDDTFRLKFSLKNESQCAALERSAVLAHSLLAAHLLIGCTQGEFVSLLDPTPEFASAARACAQSGLWPVLAGKPESSQVLIASPIILYDHPQIAGESRADSCDATEIDEILMLRVLTLSDAEKAELCAGDSRARQILTRAEALDAREQMRLHGRLRDTERTSTRIRVGERVRLRPNARADIFDLSLSGRTATVRAIERDFEDRVHLSVTIDDDPGADLGELGFPGHRFFFFADEVEPLTFGVAE